MIFNIENLILFVKKYPINPWQAMSLIVLKIESEGGATKFDTICMQKTNLQFRMHKTIIPNFMAVNLIISNFY